MNVEKHSIDFIPEAERHGSVSNLFTVWFASNMQITPLVTGALGIVFGLNLLWSIIAIVLGNLIGAIFMAYHSAQGPKLGIPQMIQSRAQFGIIGAIFPLLIVVLMYVGFFASSGVLGAQALSNVTGGGTSVSILILSVLTLVVTLFGYDVIHALEKYLSVVFLIVFIFATVFTFRLALPKGSFALGHVDFPMFLLFLSIAATWQIAYAPYVADYSRYLPKNTSIAKTFGYSYAGTVISSVWMMILGVVLTAAIPKFLDNSTSGIAHLFGNGGWAVFMYIIIVLGVLAVNVLNLYGAFMSVTTCLEAFTKLRGTPTARFWLVTITTVAGTILAILGQGNFLDNFSNFLLFLTYFLIPWTSINLVDFYFVRRGEYSVKDIFDIHGIYGAVNWTTISTYVISILIEIPFIDTTIYTGPLSKAMGGADITWIVGLVVSAPLYYFLTRGKVRPNAPSLRA